MERVFHNNGILNEEELKILWVFRNNIHKQLIFKEIKKLSKKKSQHFVFNALKKMVIMNIITLKKAGKTNLYSINLKNNFTITYLSFLEECNAKSISYLPHNDINKLIGEIKTPFFTYIIAGSYAIGKQKPTSDIDVAVIIDDEADKRPIEAVLRGGELMIPEVHPYVFTKSEFLEMLTNKEANYGKMISEKKLIVYGAHAYYRIMKEAMEHGFAG